MKGEGGGASHYSAARAGARHHPNPTGDAMGKKKRSYPGDPPRASAASKTCANESECTAKRERSESSDSAAGASESECSEMERNGPSEGAVRPKLCAARVVETLRTLTIEQLRCVDAADGLSSPVQGFRCANLRQPSQWPSRSQRPPRALRRVSGP